MKKIMLILAITTLMGSCAYNRAMKLCQNKCLPHTAIRVEYNYSNDQYDRCVCNNSIKLIPLKDK